MKHSKEVFEKNEPYFYYVPKNSKHRMRIEFGTSFIDDPIEFRKKYYLEGIFVPHKGFKIPQERYVKFKRERLTEINGDFVKIKKEAKPYV